ncbi:MAG: hypothetical protein SCH98_09395 [Deferrisomatales bacterium]|nr:hypothetical protein [Deferrisomatales bacterium]
MEDASGLTWSTRVSPGHLATKADPGVPFERVVLELCNGGPRSVTGLRVRLEALQGEGPILDAEVPLPGELAPGDCAAWDLYEVFLERGRGFRSKVHLFGIKAALGWDFTVRASVAEGGEGARAGCRVRWSGPPEGPITASVEPLP